jgi:hypothetical protein
MFCGRTDLRGTIVLRDEDGEITFAGSECGRKIAGRPVRAEANKAQRRAVADARVAAADAAKDARAAARAGMTRDEALATCSDALAPFIVRELRRGHEGTWAMFFDGSLGA